RVLFRSAGKGGIANPRRLDEPVGPWFLFDVTAQFRDFALETEDVRELVALLVFDMRAKLSLVGSAVPALRAERERHVGAHRERLQLLRVDGGNERLVLPVRRNENVDVNAVADVARRRVDDLPFRHLRDLEVFEVVLATNECPERRQEEFTLPGV